jgi:mono/diheme cytochrome c family protein
MKKLLRAAGILVAVLLLAVGALYAWATAASGKLLARTVDTHSIDFPVPFPLSDDEVAELGLDEGGARRVALERAIERGRHLVSSRYACAECHGEDFSGGVMVDAPIMGRLLGPNLTLGAGSRTVGYTPADWDRIVRHGVRPDGRPAAMPSEDFQLMSDEELSDIVAYLQAQPPVDNEVPPVTLGPLGRVLVAAGQIPLSADLIGAHDAEHPLLPPPAEVSIEFGRHVSGVCTGCHGADMAGGPVAGGDPSWPPARNLTPDPSGLAGWSFEEFVTAMRESRRPDGSELRFPMSSVAPFAQNMTDVELEAMWHYLQSIPPVAK